MRHITRCASGRGDIPLFQRPVTRAVVSPAQNITTIRLPFLLFDVLGLGWAALPEFWATHNKTELMFSTLPVHDALWGAHDQLIADLINDLNEVISILDILKLNISRIKFDKAPGTTCSCACAGTTKLSPVPCPHRLFHEH